MKKFFSLENSLELALALIGLALLILGIGLVIFSGIKNTIEDYEKQVNELRSTVLKQHYEIIALDADQLAYDIVYIDAETGTDFLYRFIGKTAIKSNAKKSEPYPDQGFPYNTEYTTYDFCELVQTFKEDSTKMDVAVEIVRECYRNKDNHLTVLDSKAKNDITKALTANITKSVDRDRPKSPTPKSDSNSKEPATHVESHNSIEEEAKG